MVAFRVIALACERDEILRLVDILRPVAVGVDVVAAVGRVHEFLRAEGKTGAFGQGCSRLFESDAAPLPHERRPIIECAVHDGAQIEHVARVEILPLVEPLHESVIGIVAASISLACEIAAQNVFELRTERAERSVVEIYAHGGVVNVSPFCFSFREG